MSRILSTTLIALAVAGMAVVGGTPSWAKSHGGGGSHPSAQHSAPAHHSAAAHYSAASRYAASARSPIAHANVNARTFNSSRGVTNLFVAHNSGGHPSFSHGAPSHAFSAPGGAVHNFARPESNFSHQNFNRGNSFAVDHGWNQGWNNHGWDGHDHGHNYNNGWGWAFTPWLGGYWGNWYPGYYWNNYAYGYPDYGYDYASPDYAIPNTYTTVPNVETAPNQGAVSTDETYLDQAVAQFQNGNYQEAERLAGHAIVDQPQDPAAHALMCLSGFATGDYRMAAGEAHVVAQINGVPSWSQVYGFYGDVDRFTTNLRTLEASVKDHPTDAQGQFLLGFLYMSMGHRAEAQAPLAQAVSQMPKDTIAQNLLSDAGGQVPTTATRPALPDGSNVPQLRK